MLGGVNVIGHGMSIYNKDVEEKVDKCEYCRSGKSIINNPTFDIKVTKDGELGIFSEYILTEFCNFMKCEKINFCPMCGRNLMIL